MGKLRFEQVPPVEIVRPAVTTGQLLAALALPFIKAYLLMIGLGYVVPDWGIGYWKALWIWGIASLLFDHNGYVNWSRARKAVKR